MSKKFQKDLSLKNRFKVAVSGSGEAIIFGSDRTRIWIPNTGCNNDHSVFAGRLHAVHNHQAESGVLDPAQALASYFLKL